VTDFSSEANGPENLSLNGAEPDFAIGSDPVAGSPDAGSPDAGGLAWAAGLSDDNRALVEARRWHGEDGVKLWSAPTEWPRLIVSA
jgi:hypothetical protein